MDHRLPLIWLNNQEQGKKVLKELGERLCTSSRYRVPHARVNATPEQAASDIHSLLRNICGELAAPRFGGEQLRFQYYELIEWLMNQELLQFGSEERTKEITSLLREHYRHRSRDDGSDIKKLNFSSPWYQLLVWASLRVLPEALFRAAVSGTPGIGSRYRWFMRQQYLAPLQSVNFIGFAERLTKGAREREDADQVDKLLVHAFLQDLRRAYSRRLWRIEGLRRTAYPVVLIDNVTKDSTEYRLLQLVNDVRNETGQIDPLLVVCSSDEIPQRPTSDSARDSIELGWDRDRNVDPVYRKPVYKAWIEALPSSRRARIDTAWDLPISVTGARSADQRSGPPIVPRPPSRLARRSLLVAAVLTLVAAVIAGVGGLYGDWWTGWPDGSSGWRHAYMSYCAHTPVFGEHTFILNGEVNVRSINGECIGYSDGSFRFNDVPGQKDAPGQKALLHIQDTIFKQNQEAYNNWEQGNRARPYVTLIYLGSFTGRPVIPTEEAYSGEREELEGLALAQYDNNNQPPSIQYPLLNIVIANGGHDMEYASEAVDMIGSLAASDPTVVGVIGMDESRDTTARAIAKLNTIGLPVISTTLSADHMDNNSQLYLQIGAPNLDQAKLIVAYSKQVLNVHDALVYWPAGHVQNIDKDFYVKTLVDDLNTKLNDSGIKVDNSLDERFSQLPADVCAYRGVIIFAGRWEDFQDFLGEFPCANSQLLNVIADDSVSRYVVNPALRRSAPATLPVTYVSKTSLITCDSLRDARNDPENHFYDLIAEQEGKGIFWSRPCDRENDEIAERVPIAYDATKLALKAVADLGKNLLVNPYQAWNPRSITPISVYLKIRQIIHQNLFVGVTGTINFTDDGPDPGQPVNRETSLLRMNSVPDTKTLPAEVFHCGGQARTNAALPSETGTTNPDPASENGHEECNLG